MFEHSTPDELTSPFNIIFSCVVCQKTIGDLYGQRSSQDQAGDQRHCKLWLTKCSHLICCDHLKDAGQYIHSTSKFHHLTVQGSNGPRPTAICPLCATEKNDKSPKSLFGIYGPEAKNHDESIPADWFDVPPIDLTRSAPSALRVRDFLSLEVLISHGSSNTYHYFAMVS